MKTQKIIKRAVSLMLVFVLMVGIIPNFGTKAEALSAINYGAAVTTNVRDYLNVRSGAGYYSVIDSLPPSSYVTKISRSINGFTQIAYTSGGYSRTGWVSTDYLKHLYLWVADVVNVSSVLNVRSGPGTCYSRKATLQPNVRIVVDLLITTPGWCRVYYNKNQVGYISTSYIATR